MKICCETRDKKCHTSSWVADVIAYEPIDISHIKSCVGASVYWFIRDDVSYPGRCVTLSISASTTGFFIFLVDYKDVQCNIIKIYALPLCSWRIYLFLVNCYLVIQGWWHYDITFSIAEKKKEVRRYSFCMTRLYELI